MYNVNFLNIKIIFTFIKIKKMIEIENLTICFEPGSNWRFGANDAHETSMHLSTALREQITYMYL